MKPSLISRQPYVASLLQKSFDKKRFSHAYLFEGDQGAGKRMMAKALATMIIDPEYPKETVIAKAIEQESYANLHLIEPDGQAIKKEQIQALIQELNKTSLLEGPRVYIINHVDTMTSSAANSLLKYFEEPHPNTHAILITEHIGQILKTIISRAQVLHFQPVATTHIKEQLIALNIPPLKANLAALLSTTLDQAKELCAQDDFTQMLDITIELGNILAKKYYNALVYFNEHGRFIGRDNIDLFLQLLIYYVKDIVNYQTDQPLLFDDRKNIKELAQRPQTNWLSILEFLMDQRAHLRYYPNVGLMLDRIMMRLDRRSYE
jgi:DNA polymerase III subunit delta'